MTEQELMVRTLMGQQPTRLAGDVIPGPGSWESHLQFPNSLRPRRELGQAGIDLMGPSSLDLSNVIQPAWPSGAYAPYWERVGR